MKKFRHLRESENCFWNPAVGPLGHENAVDTADAAIHDIASPESIRLLNVYLGQATRRGAINPYDVLRTIQKKLSIVGLQFIMPSRILRQKATGYGPSQTYAANVQMGNGEISWNESYPLTYLGGRYGVLDRNYTVGSDDNIRHRTGHGLTLRVRYTQNMDKTITVNPEIVPDNLPVNEGVYWDKFKDRSKRYSKGAIDYLNKSGHQGTDRVAYGGKDKTTKSFSKSGRSSSITKKYGSHKDRIRINPSVGRRIFNAAAGGVAGVAGAAATTGAEKLGSLAKAGTVRGTKLAATGAVKSAKAAGSLASSGVRKAFSAAKSAFAAAQNKFKSASAGSGKTQNSTTASSSSNTYNSFSTPANVTHSDLGGVGKTRTITHNMNKTVATPKQLPAVATPKQLPAVATPKQLPAAGTIKTNTGTFIAPGSVAKKQAPSVQMTTTVKKVPTTPSGFTSNINSPSDVKTTSTGLKPTVRLKLPSSNSSTTSEKPKQNAIAPNSRPKTFRVIRQNYRPKNYVSTT